jgi:hypothetical protein
MKEKIKVALQEISNYHHVDSDGVESDEYKISLEEVISADEVDLTDFESLI